jgi:CheY-like chemotaxis protein
MMVGAVSAPDDRRGPQPQLLFVERDPTRHRLAKEMLQGAGARVIERAPGAAIGEEVGLSLAIVSVTSDDDLQTVRMLSDAALPVVVVATSAELAAAGRAAGASEALVEPVAMTAMFDAIGRYLLLS